MTFDGPADPETRLRGLVTEHHLELAEREFPGILRVWRSAAGREARTFLDLLAVYGAFSPRP
jgi:hypothetical protein